MTIDSDRKTRNTVLARAGIGAAAAGSILAAANFFASKLPVQLGVNPELEAMIVAVHAGAAVASLGLLLLGLSRPRLVLPALRHPLTLAPLLVAVWSTVLAPIREFPLNALLGNALTAEGALMYAEIAAFTAAAMVLRRFRAGLLVVSAIVAVGALVPAVLSLNESLAHALREYLSFFALTSAALVMAVCRRLPMRATAALAAAAALPALVLSLNRSIVLAVIVGIFVAGAFLLLRRRTAPRWHHWAAAGLVPLVTALVTAAVAWVGYRGWVASLTSRLYLDRISLEALHDRPLSFLIGQGWGRTSETILLHFNASRAVLWDQSWDGTTQRFTHVHNYAFETVLSAGVPALVGIVAMIAFVPLFARRRLLPVAAGYAVALTVFASLWFELPMTVPAVALTAGWLARPMKPWCRWPGGASARMVGLGLLGLISASAAAAAVWLGMTGLEMRHAYFPGSGNETVACEAMPLDLDRGSFSLAQVFFRAQGAAFASEQAGKGVDPAATAQLDRMLCAVGRAAAFTSSADLLIAPVLFRGEIAFNAALPQSRARYADTLATWDRALVRFLARAPRRTDLAWYYLAWRLQENDFGPVYALSNRLLAQDPNDPVGLWFLGSLYIRSDQPSERKEGFAILRKSLDAGIVRFVPIPQSSQDEILRQSAAP